MSYVVEQEREATETSAPTAEDRAFFDNLLGNKALFFFDEAAPILRLSVPTLYRRCADGRLDYVMVGRRRALTNAVMREKARSGI
jgi:excisionase family DNA binding protein